MRKEKKYGKGKPEDMYLVSSLSDEGTLCAGPGHNRVRNPCGCTGCDCHRSNHAVSAQNPRVVECHCGRYQRPVVLRSHCNASGQATVEYALVTAAFLAVLAGLAAMKNLFLEGSVVDHGLASASHHAQAALGWIADVFAY